MSQGSDSPGRPEAGGDRPATPLSRASATPPPIESSPVRVDYQHEHHHRDSGVEPAAVRGVERRVGHGRWRSRSRWRGLAAIVVVLAALAGLVIWRVHIRLHEYTDNAYVVANITPISAEVSGPVVALFVDDNMIVQPGQPIAQIDPVPFQVQVDQASSEFQQAQFDVRAAVTNVGYFQQDRKSLLDGAAARRAEAQEGVNAADYVLKTRKEILEKDRDLLASLKEQRPGLEALMVNARDYHRALQPPGRHGRHPGTGPGQPRGGLSRRDREAEIARQQHRGVPAAGRRQRLAVLRGEDPARAESQGPGQRRRRGRPGRGRPVGAPDPGADRHRAAEQVRAGGGQAATRPAAPELHAHPAHRSAASSAGAPSNSGRRSRHAAPS